MERIAWAVWFLVTVATLWDMRRCYLRSRASLARVEASSARIAQAAERIAQRTAEVLRRTPELHGR